MEKKISNIVQEIEITGTTIKTRNASNSFDPHALAKFELIYFITMDIARYELLTVNSLSDGTAEAINQIFTFQCFEYYYRDYPNIYAKTAELFILFCDFNEKLKNDDLGGNMSTRNSDWKLYFNRILRKLLL